MVSQPSRFLWYLALIVLLLFALKAPVVAAHLARMGGDLLSSAAGSLSKLVAAL
jgi:hypothetical protein